MMDHIRAIENRRLTTKVSELPHDLQQKVKENLKIVLNLNF
jgi:mRNA-degrading endonuclease toxin of MazEF toxin-antitoxin module